MPKSHERQLRQDFSPNSPNGLPHGTKFLREVRVALRDRRRETLEGKEKSPDEEKDCLATEGRQANPNQKYRVGGKIVEGKDFPGGQLPENARPTSPAPWKHLVKPKAGSFERFGQTPPGKERS